jgi:hypothetical protein
MKSPKNNRAFLVLEFFKYFDLSKINRWKEDALNRKAKKVTLNRE